MSKEAGLWLIFIVIGGGDRLDIVGFKHLVTIQTPEIVHTVPSSDKFSPAVYAHLLHKDRDYPYSIHPNQLVKA